MEAVQAVRKSDEKYTLDDAVNVLFSKLDAAIDDMENGRVISAEDMWKELERVSTEKGKESCINSLSPD